jgi:hypothetical protein
MNLYWPFFFYFILLNCWIYLFIFRIDWVANWPKMLCVDFARLWFVSAIATRTRCRPWPRGSLNWRSRTRWTSTWRTASSISWTGCTCLASPYVCSSTSTVSYMSHTVQELRIFWSTWCCCLHFIIFTNILYDIYKMSSMVFRHLVL